MALRRIDFPVLARGMDREAPRGALGTEGARLSADGPLWRDLVNLVPHEGELRRREAVVEATGGLPTFLDSENQSVVGLFRVIPRSTLSAGRWLLVTTRELFIGTFGAWTNITPRYSTGTVSVTNGGTTVTGVGTLWKTRGIFQTQQVELPNGSGSWYEIASVVSDTSITLATPFTGTTLAGAAYQIRRTFAMNETHAVFVANLNNDLYLAGMVSGGTIFGLGLNAEDGGVLKIAGGADPLATMAVSDVSFVTSGANEVETGVDYLNYNLRNVNGMVALADGRLVILVEWFDLSAGQSGGNRVAYSSPLNVAVWTATPGGFTDIVGYKGIGTAMTGGSRGVVVHFHDGIEVGDLTGAQDPPLRFRPTEARIGAAAPRLIQRIPGGRALPPGDVFVGNDGAVYVFNGGDATPVAWASTKADLAGSNIGQAGFNIPTGFSRADTFRGYVSFFYRNPSFDTFEIRLYYHTGVYVRCRYAFSTLTAASAPLDQRIKDGDEDTSGYFGTPRVIGGTEATSLLYEITDDELADELVVFPGSSAIQTVKAQTDFFTEPSRRWAFSHIEAVVKPKVSSPADLDLVIVRDDDQQGALETVTASAVAGGKEQVLTFYPGQRSARRNQIKFVGGATTDGHLFEYALTSMTVWLADVGEARTG